MLMLNLERKMELLHFGMDTEQVQEAFGDPKTLMKIPIHLLGIILTQTRLYSTLMRTKSSTVLPFFSKCIATMGVLRTWACKATVRGCRRNGYLWFLLG